MRRCGATGRSDNLLDARFLIVQFLPLPSALHPDFTDVYPRVAYLRRGRELNGAFVDDQGGIRSQRNQLVPPQRIVEDILHVQFIDRLNLIPLATAIDLDSLIVLRQQFGVTFLVLVLQRFPFGFDLRFEHILQLRVVGGAARLPIFVTLNRHGGVLRQSERGQKRKTSQDEATTHKSSEAKGSEILSGSRQPRRFHSYRRPIINSLGDGRNWPRFIDLPVSPPQDCAPVIGQTISHY